MSYDDIRFSWWDDPDDNEIEPDHYVEDYPRPIEDLEIKWVSNHEMTWDDEPLGQSECNMCGKERILNEKGYCSTCWQIWNS